MEDGPCPEFTLELGNKTNKQGLSGNLWVSTKQHQSSWRVMPRVGCKGAQSEWENRAKARQRRHQRKSTTAVPATRPDGENNMAHVLLSKSLPASNTHSSTTSSETFPHYPILRFIHHFSPMCVFIYMFFFHWTESSQSTRIILIHLVLSSEACIFPKHPWIEWRCLSKGRDSRNPGDCAYN